MNKKLSIILAVTALMVAVVPVHAQGSLPTQLEYIDAQVAVFTPYLTQYQADYFSANGYYFQALQSHSVAPDGLAVVDELDTHPTDQAEALAVLWSYAGLPTETNFAFKVDTYSGPDGDGYVLTVETVIEGDTWLRSINYGPASEAWRQADWYKVIPFTF